MKIDTLKCDRCNSVFQRKKEDDYIRIVTQKDIDKLKSTDYKDGNVAYIVFKYTTTGLDLCSKCYQELENWLKAYPKEIST